MSKQQVKYKIAGSNRSVAFREHETIAIEAVFGTENSASVSLDTVTFVNSDGADNKTLLLDAWQSNPLVGALVELEIFDLDENGNPIGFTFDFCTDWNKLNFLSPSEIEVGLFERKGLFGFDQRAAAITFALLEDKGFLTPFDYSNIPYIVENRKTELEKIQLLAQTWITIKSGIDEVHKIINIASDIVTLGAVQAAVNLAATIAGLVLIVQRLVQLFKDIQEAFFPPVLYHSGIKPKVFIEKACQYMGYSGVDFGTLTDLIDHEYWVPSKNDEIGLNSNTVNPDGGALKPNDTGYNLLAMVGVIQEKYNCDRAIINNVFHLRPKSDPFWTQSPVLTLPDVKIEQAFVGNGTFRPNYEDFFSSRILQYATDDSDLWTLEDLAVENDPASSQKIIAGVITEPDNVADPRCVISQQGKFIDLPHTLCTRKDLLDELLDLLFGAGDQLDAFKIELTNRFNEFTDVLGQSIPGLDTFVQSAGGRNGAMKVENHYFSIAKCVYMEPVNIGFGFTQLRIPANFSDYIGARAIIDNYHNWESFVPGVRNPNDLNDTNAKYRYENVTIDMNLRQFTKILENPYFSIQGGSIGKFTRVNWSEREDKAEVDFWTQEPWMNNVTEKKI